jgi:hypothetical protein
MHAGKVSPDGGSKILFIVVVRSWGMWIEMARCEGKGRLLHGIGTCSHNGSAN